jgi:hypothetical protein
MDIEINTENGWMPANIPPTPNEENDVSADYLVLALNHKFYIGTYFFEKKYWEFDMVDFTGDITIGNEVIAYYKPPPVIFDYHPGCLEEIVF